jgi:AAA domain
MSNYQNKDKGVWENLPLADDNVAYLKRKNIKSHGYCLNDKGDLMIPIHDKSGAIDNYQIVNDAGNKIFGRGKLTNGTYHTLGKYEKGPIVICVDFESGATIYENTSHHTVVTFTNGNLLTVAQSIRRQFKDIPIIIAGDDDQSITKLPNSALEVAHKINAHYISPEFGSHKTSNHKSFNDLACIAGGFLVSVAFDAWESIPVVGPKKFSLSDFSLKGQSAELRKQMLDEIFVLGDLALLGQWTVFYAAPNAGKTLLTIKMLIDALKTKKIKGENVYYINADDDRRGLVTKLELAEQYGFEMLVPSEKGFESEKLRTYLGTLVKQDSSRGKIIILDTLKKFVDLMHKTKSSDFGKFAREFVSHGGTIIGLAHVNKNKNPDSKSVFAGTSDITDDADCYYVIEVVHTSKDTKTIRFENQKSRGNVAKQATFKYSNEKLPYLELLDSVKTMSEDEAIAMRAIEESNNALNANKEVIDSVIAHIKDGFTNKTELIRAVSKSTMTSNTKIKAVLDKHNGKEYEKGHRWDYTVGEKNVHTYYLTTANEKLYKDK